MFVSKSRYESVKRDLERCMKRDGKIYASFDNIVMKYGEDVEDRFRETLGLHIFVTDDKYEFTPSEYVYVCTGIK